MARAVRKGKTGTVKYARRVYNHPRDCGAEGRNTEVEVRLAMNPRTRNLRAAPVGQVDISIRSAGWESLRKMLRIECKTRGGSVTATYTEDIFRAYNLHDRDAIAQYILPGMDYVAYAFDKNGEPTDILVNMAVFTREEFLNFLFGYRSPMVKFNNKSTDPDAPEHCLNIQINGKKRMQYIADCCFNQPNLAEWLESIGRAVPAME